MIGLLGMHVDPKTVGVSGTRALSEFLKPSLSGHLD